MLTFFAAPIMAAKDIARRPVGLLVAFLIPLLVMSIWTVIVLNLYDRQLADYSPSVGPGFNAGLLVGAGLLGQAAIAAYAAVTWHRVALLEPERSRPRFILRMRYFGTVLLIGLIVAVCINFPGTLFIDIFPNPMLYWPLFFALSLVLNITWMSLGLVLPAMAVGRDMTFGAAIQYARDNKLIVIGAAAVYVVVQELVYALFYTDSLLPSAFLQETLLSYMPLSVLAVVMQTALYRCVMPRGADDP